MSANRWSDAKARPRQIGAYVIEGLIAEGGMGTVYRAHNLFTGGARAVKVIRRDLAHDPVFVDHFLREAGIAASIEHENLVRVYDPGMDGSNVFLPMELLRGETLDSVLRREGRLCLEDAVTLLLGICKGVSAIHRKGYIHRDIKPLNLFLALDEDGEVTPKVLDFGAARDSRLAAGPRTVGLVVGTIHYMAPEQAAGEKSVDHRADQYALGVVGYQILSGQRLFQDGDTGSAFAKLLRGDAYPPLRDLVPSLPLAVAQVIARALSRHPGDRYPTVDHFAAALAVAASSASTGHLPASLVDPGAVSSDEATRMLSEVRSKFALRAAIRAENGSAPDNHTAALDLSDPAIWMVSRPEAPSERTVALDLDDPALTFGELEEEDATKVFGATGLGLVAQQRAATPPRLPLSSAKPSIQPAPEELTRPVSRVRPSSSAPAMLKIQRPWLAVAALMTLLACGSFWLVREHQHATRYRSKPSLGQRKRTDPMTKMELPVRSPSAPHLSPLPETPPQALPTAVTADKPAAAVRVEDPTSAAPTRSEHASRHSTRESVPTDHDPECGAVTGIPCI